MGQFLQLILDNLYKLWPYRIIDADCQGVRLFRGGMTLLQPGGHWFIPGLQQIEEFVVTYQNLDCGEQSITTKDGVEVTLSLNLAYRITDLARQRRKFQHFDTTVRNDARGIVYEVVAGSTYGELLGNPRKLRGTLLRALRLQFRDSGVRIAAATLDQFVKTRQYRIFSNAKEALW